MNEREAMTLRIPSDLADELGLYRALTGVPANTLVVRLLTQFFAGAGRQEIVAAMTERARERYGMALDELDES